MLTDREYRRDGTRVRGVGAPVCAKRNTHQGAGHHLCRDRARGSAWLRGKGEGVGKPEWEGGGRERRDREGTCVQCSSAATVQKER